MPSPYDYERRPEIGEPSKDAWRRGMRYEDFSAEARLHKLYWVIRFGLAALLLLIIVFMMLWGRG